MEQQVKKVPKDTKYTKHKRANERFGIFSYVISNITKNRWRTALTVIGIAIPIAFFVLFSAMGDGLDEFIDSEFESSKSISKAKYVQISKIVKTIALWKNYPNLILHEPLQQLPVSRHP